MFVSITWNGEVHDTEVPEPCTAALALEAFLSHHPSLRILGLALFDSGGQEVPGYRRVSAEDDLILRPRVIH